MTTTLRPSAGRDVFDLVNKLASAGWGPLDGPENRSARFLLRSLADLAYDARKGRSGVVTTTAPQLADRTGYSERWTRYGLRLLEDLGIIEWRRGGIIEGAPTPSVIRLVKTVIADLVEAARVRHSERLSKRAKETTTRIKQTVIFRRCRGRAPSRIGELHPEVTTSLPPYRGRKGRNGSALPAQEPLFTKTTTPRRQKEEAMRPLKKPPAYYRFLAVSCTHGEEEPRRCNRCRFDAILAFQDDQKRARTYEPAPDTDEPSDYPKPFVEYMESTYPTAKRFQWARIIVKDKTARTLMLIGDQGTKQ